jgi:hypothetical protein
MPDMEDADNLAEKLMAVINSCDDTRTRLMAAIMVVADCVGGIDCRDCRKLAKKSAIDLLPKLIREAMERPTSGSGHVH